MKRNTDKCHLIESTNNAPELKVGDSLIKTSTCEKLVGVKIDYKLTFDIHVASLCKKANGKLRTLARPTPYITIEKWKLLMNSFFNAQLTYFPLISMLHDTKRSATTQKWTQMQHVTDLTAEGQNHLPS